MTRKYKKKVLTDTQKKKYQRRLSHFFRDIKYRHSLQSKDLAEALEYTPQKFSVLESETKPHGRFTNSLEFLYSIASLDELSLSEFIFFIDGDTSRFKGVNSNLKRQMQEWEKEIVRSFSTLPLKTLRNFIDIVCKDSSTSNNLKLEKLIGLVIEMYELEEEALSGLLTFIKSKKGQ